tara:strand:+ start:1036 stop:2100 length:1065 start_codon:yes stop_codon:yes gene_type:complete
MGFFSNLFGTNQKRSVGTVGQEYTDAFEPANTAYNSLMSRGQDMMDPNSAFNQSQRARMEAQGADAAAMSARMAQRTAAMSGGAPAGALAAQAQAGANRAQESSMNAFNQYLQGAMGQGAGMLSGAANNLANMNVNRMNAMNAQRQANAQIDSQAAGAKASLIGTGLSLAGTAVGGPIGGMIGGALGSLFGQEGGSVPEDLEYMMYGGMVRDKRMSPEDKTEKIEMQTGGPVNKAEFKPHKMYDEDGKAHMARTYEQHLAMKKKGFDHYGPKGKSKGYMYGGPVMKYKDGGPVLKPIPEGNVGLSKLPEAVRNKMGYMKTGGYVYGQEGGMLSQVMGPRGPMQIGTRMGGVQIG